MQFFSTGGKNCTFAILYGQKKYHPGTILPCKILFSPRNYTSQKRSVNWKICNSLSWPRNYASQKGSLVSLFRHEPLSCVYHRQLESEMHSPFSWTLFTNQSIFGFIMIENYVSKDCSNMISTKEGNSLPQYSHLLPD